MSKPRLKTYDPDLVLPQHRLPVFRRVIKGQEFIVIGTENMWQYCSVCNTLKNEKDFALHSHVNGEDLKKVLLLRIQIPCEILCYMILNQNVMKVSLFYVT